MADGGVWARLPQPNNGGGIWTKTSSGWVEIGGGGGSDGLEGLGNWAVITEVTGSPKRYAYNDGSMDWVAFEWTQDGSVTTQAGGLVDALLVGGGGGAPGIYSKWGWGGRVHLGLTKLSSTDKTVTVGLAGQGGGDQGSLTSLGSIATLTAGGADQKVHALGAGADALGDRNAGINSNITGQTDVYGVGAESAGRANKGSGAVDGGIGTSGCCIVRVPAAQAAGVDPGSWVTRIDYYAEVTDGIVTDLYQERFYGDDTVRTENGRYASPEQPDDLIPCDPTVAEGWTYADGEFTPPPPPPPPTRDELIEALQEQLKDLQKDT